MPSPVQSAGLRRRAASLLQMVKQPQQSTVVFSTASKLLGNNAVDAVSMHHCALFVSVEIDAGSTALCGIHHRPRTSPTDPQWSRHLKSTDKRIRWTNQICPTRAGFASISHCAQHISMRDVSATEYVAGNRKRTTIRENKQTFLHNSQSRVQPASRNRPWAM